MGDRGHLLCLVEHTTVTLVVVLISIRNAGTNLHDLVDLVVDIDTAGVTLELIALQQTFVVHGCHRDVEVGLLATALNSYLVVLRNAVVDDHVEPVGIALVIVDVECWSAIFQIEGQHVGRCSRVGENPIVGCCILVILLVKKTLYLLVAVHGLHDTGSAIERKITVESYRGLTGLTALGGDQNYTISTLGTIDSGRSSILQDIH